MSVLLIGILIFLYGVFYFMIVRKKVTSEAALRIKVTSKMAPRISAKEIAKALGADIVTDPKEMARLKKIFRRRP